MILFLHLIWVLVTVLRFAGIIVIFGGVGVFGFFFVGGNARAARSSSRAIPISSWLGKGPREGMRIVVFGAAMLVIAYVIQLFLPNGT